VTGVNGADLAPACDRAAAHLAGRERELTLTLAAVAGFAAGRLGAEAATSSASD